MLPNKWEVDLIFSLFSIFCLTQIVLYTTSSFNYWILKQYFLIILKSPRTRIKTLWSPTIYFSENSHKIRLKHFSIHQQLKNIVKFSSVRFKWWIKTFFPRNLLRSASSVNKGVLHQSDLHVAKVNPINLYCSGLQDLRK